MPSSLPATPASSHQWPNGHQQNAVAKHCNVWHKAGSGGTFSAVLKIQKIRRGEVGRVKYPLKEQGQQEEFALAQSAGVERERELTGYFSEHGKAGARWLGSAAAGLGFREGVSDERLEGLILEHRAANGEEIHRMHGRMEIVGLEVDISAPKSFSDLYAIGDEWQRRRLMEVWNEAVSDMVSRMERDYVRTRDGAGEARHHMLTGGVTVRAYTHFTSRDQDPQLHAHLLLPNMARERLTGKWKALDTAFLYGNAKALGHWFEVRLRELAERELGIEWGEVSKGVAEIQGVPESYIQATSQRSQVIKAKAAVLADQGVHVDLHMRDEIAMETRRGKELIEDLGEWQELQRVIAAEHGLDAEAVAALTPGGRQVESSGVDVAKIADRLLGPTGLTLMETTFEPGKILIALTDAGIKEHELDGAIAQILADGRVVAVSNLLGPTYTTLELLEREQELIDAYAQAVGTAEDLIVPGGVVDSVLAGAELTLNDDQLAALRAVTGGRDGMVVVQARAGTGKTTLARFARQAYERVGVGVVGAAPTAQAKRELQAAGIVNSETLARLAGHVRDGGKLTHLLPDGVRRGVLMLDEAGMAHTREAALVITQARREGMKVVVMGDSRQLQSVQAGGWMGHLHRTYGGPTLSEVVRQRDKRERHALVEVAARKPRAYIQHQLKHDRIHEYKLKDIDAAVEHASTLLLEQAEVHGYGNTLLMSHGNQRRIQLNETVQEMRGAQGVLGEEPLMTSSEAQDLYAGDRVVLKRNHRRLDVDNGMRATILGTTGDGELLVGLDGDKDVLRILPGWYVDEHVRLGYAVTIYGAQGATVEHAILAANPDELNANNGYVAFSRDRESTTIILIGDAPKGKTLTDQLQASLQRDGEEQLATAQIREWVQGLETDPDLDQHLAEEAAYERYQEADEETLARTAQQLEDTEQERLDEVMRAAIETNQPAAQVEPDVTAAVSPNAARDEYLAARDAIEKTARELQQPWARQAALTRKLTGAAAHASQHAEHQAAVPEPAAWERAQRRAWRQRNQTAKAAMETVGQQARQAREQLARYGDPDQLIDQHTKLKHDREHYLSRTDLMAAAYAEEIARQPAYLTEALGSQPVDRNGLRRWTTAAHNLILDRWNRGILHDQPATPSPNVERSISQYLQHVRGHGQDQGLGM
jgi:conjugative relaxase-like TrwC/TraI family protein